MLVKEYMTRHPLMVEPTMSIVDAQRFMNDNNVRHLPVVGDGKRLVGLLTRQNLLVDPHRLASLDIWEIARTLAGLTVKDVMIKARDVVCMDPGLTIEEAARLMVARKIGCLPVLEDDVVVGILTEADLLAHLAELMGSRWQGVRVTVRMPDRKGEFAKLVSAISAQGWGITAMGGVPTPRQPESWDAVVKLRSVTKEQVVAALSGIADQEIVDVRET